ncbi:glycosyltransferase family 9 protein [Salicola sp. Rm-C-2C1-2]|uniref:glycosyltransferase family 9 protein n=1 Tax=Salicola sp. Rm-C-2C1-2 TaxID=3141321 RepID=UPI0032E3DEA6
MLNDSAGTSVNSICILRLSAIGDVTHVLPVIHSLQKQMPGVRITWIIGKMEARLLEGLPGVEFIVFDKSAGLRGYIDLWRQLRGRRFDVLFHMQVALRANIAALLVPASTRVGYDRERSKDLHGLFINQRIPRRSGQHVLDCLASFPTALGLKPAEPEWHLPVAETDNAFADRVLDPARPNLVISPVASHELRNWPTQRYAALADYAVHQYGVRIILVGGPSEQDRQYCQAIEEAMQEEVLNLCGQDTLKQLAALMARADLVIAPDTGPAHIANAMGTDVLGLFASSNPYRSGPYNSIEWCVNRYPQALERFTGKRVESARWGAKAEFNGAMELITVDDATAMLDHWMARRRQTA